VATSRGIFISTGVGLILAIAISIGGYVAYDTIEQQRAEIKVLVTDLATMTVERDDLIGVRDQLTAARYQLTTERDHEQARAKTAETTVARQQVRLADSNIQIDTLQAQVDASRWEAKQFCDDIATLRDRLQSVQAASRDASAAATALAAARDTQVRLSTAALSYANAEADLAKTRDTMIDTLNSQIAAERAGLRTTSNRLVDEYNRLVSLHNQQVGKANTALAFLKTLL
jgi:chromosome segregation ATPase